MILDFQSDQPEDAECVSAALDAQCGHRHGLTVTDLLCGIEGVAECTKVQQIRWRSKPVEQQRHHVGQARSTSPNTVHHQQLRCSKELQVRLGSHWMHHLETRSGEKLLYFQLI